MTRNEDIEQYNQRLRGGLKVGTQNIDDYIAVCSVFTCGRRLSLCESLAGSRCTHHMHTKQINITSTIKKP